MPGQMRQHLSWQAGAGAKLTVDDLGWMGSILSDCADPPCSSRAWLVVAAGILQVEAGQAEHVDQPAGATGDAVGA